MNPTEIALYGVETTIIIRVLWGLLLIASITVVAVSIMYVSLRVRVRAFRRRESQFAKELSSRALELVKLNAKVTELTDIAEGAEVLKTELRRLDAIRTKTEKALIATKAELEALQQSAAAAPDERFRQRA
jgi:predicted  nucleic acid-binding Zn-ribbon protein